MKKSNVLVVAILVAGCTKERSEGFVRYTAQCDSCVVEWYDDGVWRRDSLFSNVVLGPNGIDTIPAWARFNIMASTGDMLSVRCESTKGPCHLSIDGDMGRSEASDSMAFALVLRAH